MQRAKQFRQELQERGESVAGWASRHGLQAQVVHDLLRGRSTGLRGESHRAAVLMGLKKGQVKISDSKRRATAGASA